jgi:pyruvate dehydrogenase phosphatase
MLLGIFDGHAGPSCAQVIAERMLQYITVSLLPPDLLAKYRKSLDDGNDEMKLLHLFNNNLELVDKLKTLYASSLKSFVGDLAGNPRDFKMADALETAFLRLDGDLSREALPDARGRLNKRTLSVAMSGAVACVAHVDGPHLHVASAGDCQAVVGVLGDGRAWTPLRLTREHNVDNQVATAAPQMRVNGMCHPYGNPAT